MSTEKSKILLVEDEAHLAFMLKFNFEEEGFQVVSATNGKEALELYNLHKPFDVILMDVMMPEMNGYTVLERIRELDPKTSILMLTARASNSDRLKGLGLGADDYITKPFNLEELIIKLKRAAERSKMFNSSEQINFAKDEFKNITIDKFFLDMDKLTLNFNEKIINVTELEAKVLHTFFSHPEKTFSRKYLLDHVWQVNSAIETRTVDNFIVRLRKYIEDNPADPKYLKSVRGRGYRFTI